MNSAIVDPGQVRHHFSSHADDYDRYAVVQKRVVNQLSALIGTLPLPVGPLLDVGTGTGALAARLAGLFPGQPLVLSDLAHGMTLHARTALSKVSAVDADAAQLPFARGSFGMIVSSSAYQWVADLGGAFGEAARILAPGGTFALALFGGRTLHELHSSYRAAWKEFDGGGPDHLQAFPQLRQVREALEGAGFELLHLADCEEIEYHPDVPTLLRSLKRIGAQNAARNRPPGLASRRVMQRMMAHYAERYGTPEGIPATYGVVYALARRP